MNIHQEHLLNLLKEIDAFCKEHKITYYCAGGTVIGAARHRGFIPWDDDIDIYMKRDDFFRFDEALKKYGRKDRKLEYYEGDHERHAPVARYHKEDDTMFCHFNMIGRSSAGTSLDVFILDPIPDDYEARVDYLAKLYAYSDLIAPCHVYSHRLPVSEFGVYDKYRKIAEEEGTEEAIRKISAEIFRFDAADCKDYCLRWGSVPLMYPVEAIGEPVYLPFEDMMIPVPHDWYRYLSVHYGMDWINLPYEETQGEHINIVRYDMGYDYFYEKRDELYTQDYLLDLHSRWKDAEREFFRAAEPVEKYVLAVQNSICRANIEKNIRLSSAGSLEKLFEEGKYGDIIDIFAPYFERQLSYAYMGSRMSHGMQFRFQFPRIMPLSDDELHMLLMSLLKTGKERTAEKICGIYRRANISNAAVEQTAAIIDTINLGRNRYYTGDIEGCLAAIEESDFNEEIPALADLIWLCRVRGEISDEEAEQLRNRAESPAGSDYERKAWGDLLWKRGEKTGAEKVYRDLMTECRNGLFWMDIQRKVPDIAPIPTKRLTPFTDTGLTKKQRELLEEIAGICERNGIKYVVGPDLARRMYLTGNIGYVNSNREIFMDAENAAKFMEAFRKEAGEDRKLFSWKNGDAVRDFVLIYSDTGNVFCDFRRLAEWRDMGIYITIRILRSGAAGKSYRKNVLLDEFLLNIADIEEIDKRNLQSSSKRAVFLASRLMTGHMRRNFRARLFDRSIKHEKDPGSGKFYYYTNIRGMRPARHSFDRNLWENTCQLEMNGISYRVPSKITGKYVPHETDLANVPPIDSIFMYKSDRMSWEEIKPLIDDREYMALDWETYASTRRRFRKISERVWHAWWMILKEGEELDLREKAEDTVVSYREAVSNGNEAAAENAVNETDVTVKKYQALDIPVYLEPELRECYEDYLRRTGQKEFLKTISELWDRDKSSFYNN